MGANEDKVAVLARVGALSAGDATRNSIRANRKGQIVGNNGLEDVAMFGQLFSVANQAAVATTAALATTWTGLGISNPTGSGKNLILQEFGWALSVVASDDGVIGLMTSDTTGFADSLTSKAAKNAAGTSVAYADAGATIATPILERVYGAYGTEATTGFTQGPVGVVDLRGSIILPPGRSVMTYTTTATTAAFVFHFMWEEVTV